MSMAIPDDRKYQHELMENGYDRLAALVLATYNMAELHVLYLVAISLNVTPDELRELISDLWPDDEDVDGAIKRVTSVGPNAYSHTTTRWGVICGIPNHELASQCGRHFFESDPDRFRRAHEIRLQQMQARALLTDQKMDEKIRYFDDNQLWDETIAQWLANPRFATEYPNGITREDVIRDGIRGEYLLFGNIEALDFAFYRVGTDPRAALDEFEYWFAYPPEGSQPSLMPYVAQLVLRQAYLLGDYPRDLAFYREFLKRVSLR